MIDVFRPTLSSGPQVFPISGGSSGSILVRLDFEQAPSAGFVSVEGLRPGASSWLTLYGGASISASQPSILLKADGGYSYVRLTFSGISGGAQPILTVVSNETATPPSDLLTDGGFGQSRRLRVDPGQTGFFSGRFFRAYLDALIPVAGPSFQFRFTSPVDFILWAQSLELTQGAVELQIYTGATGSGTWTARPSIGVNRMAQRPTPYYSSQCIVEYGGNFSGGTEVDLLRVRASSANNTAQNVGQEWSERGLPAGTYYGRIQTLTGGLTVNDAAQLIYSLTWEERP